MNTESEKKLALQRPPPAFPAPTGKSFRFNLAFLPTRIAVEWLLHHWTASLNDASICSVCSAPSAFILLERHRFESGVHKQLPPSATRLSADVQSSRRRFDHSFESIQPISAGPSHEAEGNERWPSAPSWEVSAERSRRTRRQFALMTAAIFPGRSREILLAAERGR